MSLRSWVPLLIVSLAVLSCDGGDGGDAGMDGAIEDGGPDAARADAQPAVCEPTCNSDLACCDVPGGTACVDLRDDITNCGDCGIDCVATGRGDACTRSICSCGTATLGCRGTRENTCCVLDGITPYCGNLDQDGDNCGECGRLCDSAVGNRCDGGECRCGILREPCDGTMDSTCCVNGVDVACFDLNTDRFNCGECGNLCQGPERCENAACTRGAGVCPMGCGDREICCDGACCTRDACMEGTCGMRRDAGVGSDAGPMGDAGAPPSDAGVADAG